ncbi:MAG: hypothetical protein AAF699_17220 [Pseudomonadota bacterium]
MSEPQHTLLGSGRGYRIFTWVKYLTFALLSINVYLFLAEELGALEHTFVDGIEAGQIIQVFSATIDTGAWVILLLLFELETSVLDDSRIRGGVKWALHGLRILCMAAIVYAFTGYYAELVMLYQASPLAQFDACSQLSQNWSLILDLDEYAPLDAANCASVGSDAWRLNGFDIVASQQVLTDVRYLAWVDVINSGTWILVVLMLEVEVRLQLLGKLSQALLGGLRYIKYVLYGTLFACAIYWGFKGDFLDFWDACLWLFAFIFIELNVFDWNRTSTREMGLSSGASAL